MRSSHQAVWTAGVQCKPKAGLSAAVLVTVGGGGPVFQAAGPETKTIFSPSCTKWSLGQADSTTEVDPAMNLFSTKIRDVTLLRNWHLEDRLISGFPSPEVNFEVREGVLTY